MQSLHEIRLGGLESIVWNAPTALRRWRWRYIFAVIILALLPLFILYLKLARIVDRRLAEGLFSASVDIFSAPSAVSVGDALSPQQVVESLQRNGYTDVSGNRVGWYQLQPDAVEIFPGVGSAVEPVKLEFAGGGISSILSLQDGRRLDRYTLGPQLIASLSQTRERRRLVHYNQIPSSLVHALLSVEDKRFFRHGGFDVQRALKAAYVDFRRGQKSEGASTLTMQLARNLWLNPDKSWRRKVEESLITIYLEDKLTKQQIFESYANQIYLGREGPFSIHGFGEAARAFFGKDLSQIGTSEAALLAGLVRRPSYDNPLLHPDRARQRRNLVLALMHRNGYLDRSEYSEATAEPLGMERTNAERPASSYFIDLMNSELHARLGEEDSPNRCVYTSLDPELQRAAEASVRAGMAYVDRQLGRRGSHLAVPSGQPQVALVALDPRTGEIRALVGGRNYDSSQINHALAMRQPGSVFKPFVFAAAINTAVEGGRQIFTPASLIPDEPATFSGGDRPYAPRDFHGEFMGDVTLRTALAHSLNLATVALAEQVGYKNVVAMARRAGWNDHIRPTPAVALGAYEATPLEIAGAYTMFANHGVMVRPTTIEMVGSRDGTQLYRRRPETHQVLDPRVAYLMVSMMEEVLRSGTGAGVRARGFTLPAAGKTGTSRDGWFAGFTDGLLCVVWVGFDDNRDLRLEGARSALPIWADFMQRASQLQRYRSAHAFQRPPGVVSTEICADSGALAGPDCPNVRQEIFIAGTEPEKACDLHLRRAVPDGTEIGNESK